MANPRTALVETVQLCPLCDVEQMTAFNRIKARQLEWG